MLLNDPQQARGILAEITEQAPDFLPAWRRLAEIALAEGKLEENQKALDAVLRKSPADVDARFLRRRVHLARRETTLAIQEFQTVLKTEPRLAPARHQLALAQLQAGNVQQAKAEIKEAISRAPNFAEALLLLAEVNMQSGAIQPAIEDLERLIAAQPRTPGAYLLPGTAYLGKRDPAKAAEAYRRLVTLAPKDPRGPYLVGLGLLAQGKRADARKELEAALVLAPGFAEPLAQLVSLSQYLLGRVHLARRDPRAAEVALLKAVELEPRLVGPYVQVGNLYAVSGQYGQALGRLEDALKINPRFAPAPNNLAWLLSEHGGNC